MAGSSFWRTKCLKESVSLFLQCPGATVLGSLNLASHFSMNLPRGFGLSLLLRERERAQPILVSLGAHTLSVATHSASKRWEGSTFGLL